MFKKLLLVALLSLSIPGSALSDDRLQSSTDIPQSNESSADAKQDSRLKSLLSNSQQISTTSQQDSNAKQKPSMIDYCRKHTC